MDILQTMGSYLFTRYIQGPHGTQQTKIYSVGKNGLKLYVYMSTVKYVTRDKYRSQVGRYDNKGKLNGWKSFCSVVHILCVLSQTLIKNKKTNFFCLFLVDSSIEKHALSYSSAFGTAHSQSFFPLFFFTVLNGVVFFLDQLKV